MQYHYLIYCISTCALPRGRVFSYYYSPSGWLPLHILCFLECIHIADVVVIFMYSCQVIVVLLNRSFSLSSVKSCTMDSSILGLLVGLFMFTLQGAGRGDCVVPLSLILHTTFLCLCDNYAGWFGVFLLSKSCFQTLDSEGVGILYPSRVAYYCISMVLFP